MNFYDEFNRNFGTDPEFFITAHDSNAIPPAALPDDFGINFVGETSNGKRILFKDKQEEFIFIEDGVAVELNFLKPFNSVSYLYNTVEKALVDLRNYFNQILYPKNVLTIDKRVTINYPSRKYLDRGEKFLDCVRFGCDADYRPELYKDFDAGCEIVDSSKHNRRYAGGHLHIQNMSKNPYIYKDSKEKFPVILDLFLGTANILLGRSFNNKHDEIDRLRYFGFPGRYRIQNYSEGINGVEYRPLSNYWLSSGYFSHLSSILYLADLCGNIIENDLCDDFMDIPVDNLKGFYKSLITFERNECKRYLVNGLSRALEMNLIDLSFLTEIKPGIL